MKNILIISFIVLISNFVNAQYVQDGSTIGEEVSAPGKYGEIKIYYQGVSVDNYLKYPRKIVVNYTDKIGDKTVFVGYVLYTESNFSIDKDKKNLKYEGGSKDTLNIFGIITEDKGGMKDTLAVFKDIIYTSNPKKFDGWVVAKECKIGKSNTSLIAKTGLYCNCKDVKFTGKSVAFFRIENDFTLKLDTKPISLSPKVNQSATKTAVKK